MADKIKNHSSHQAAKPSKVFRNSTSAQNLSKQQVNPGQQSFTPNCTTLQCSSPQKFLFKPYITLEEAENGLKEGTLLKGQLRINARNFEESYIADPMGEKNDIFIRGVLGRNRALHGDVVLVRLNKMDDWRVLDSSLNPTSPNKLNSDETKISMKDIHKNSDSIDNAKKVARRFEKMYDRSTVLSVQNSNVASRLNDDLSKKLADLKICKNNFASNPSGKSILIPQKLQKTQKTTPPKKQYTLVSDLKRATPDEDELLKTGEVVYIWEKVHSRISAGCLKTMQDNNSRCALFSPNDPRVPRLMVPVEQCPPTFMRRPQDFERTLFLARIDDWTESSKFAKGSLVKTLGNAGEIEPETEGMLAQNGVDSQEFSQEVVDCLPKISESSGWTIPEEEFKYREDFRDELLFSIDPATARDLDDALHVKRLPDGFYEIGVHIADVSFFIKPFTPLDTAAGKRATSVYLVHKVIPMLPRLLCEELCSLNPNVDRLAFSVVWKMNPKGDIYEERFTRSIIRSCCKLNYDIAQSFINEPQRHWTPEDLPPVSHPHTPDDVAQAVNVLHAMAVKMRERRQQSGALRLDQPKLSFTLDKETGMPNGCSIYQLKDSNRLIEEFMLLANMAVAHRIYKHYPEVAVLRRHPVPKVKVMRQTVDFCRQFGYDLDPTTSSSLQASLAKYRGDSQRAKTMWSVLMQLLSKPMKLALYFCTGSLEDEDLFQHYALNVPLYTHFTSPIRRYPDLMVHRLLAATLNYSPVPDFPMKLVQSTAEHCNNKKWSAKTVSETSAEMFFSLFVKKSGPIEEKAVVVGIMDHSFDVIITKFGLTKRIYCNKLKGVMWDFEGNKETAIGKITLTRLATNRKIILNIFDEVDIILIGAEDSLKCEATLKLSLD